MRIIGFGLLLMTALPARAQSAAPTTPEEFLRRSAGAAVPVIAQSGPTAPAGEPTRWYREQADAAWTRREAPATTPASVLGRWRMVAEIWAAALHGPHDPDGIAGGSLHFTSHADPFDGGGPVLQARFARDISARAQSENFSLDSVQTASSTTSAAGIGQLTFRFEGIPSAGADSRSNLSWQMTCRLVALGRMICAFRYSEGYYNGSSEYRGRSSGDALLGFSRVGD